MTTAATTAHGTLLYRGASGTPRSGGQLIEEVQTMGLPEHTDEVIDVTSHDSAAVERILRGCIDYGQIEITGFYSANTGQELVRGTDLGGSATGFYVNLAGGSGKVQIYFSAVVSAWQLVTDDPGGIMYRAVLNITGAVTYTTQS